MAVECDFALTPDDKEIHILDAERKFKGYRCIGCRRDVFARKGQINDPHFAHLATHKDKTEKCTYSNETYRHAKAKEILLRIKQVQVPNVYAAYPADYTGQVPRLAKACTVSAVKVLAERNVYINEVGDIQWVRRSEAAKFDDQGGTWDFLVRPDIIFLDADDKPILFIEIVATHEASEQKLARLHLLKINTIEIVVPKSFEPEHIEGLLYVTSHTQWLYNVQRATYRFDVATASALAAGSVGVAQLPGGIYEQGETIRCRRARLDNALRYIAKCMGRPEIVEAKREVSAAQERGEGFVADRQAERQERESRLGAEVRARFDRYREERSERRRQIRVDEKQLDRDIQHQEEKLLEVFNYAKGRIDRAKAEVEGAKEQWRIDHHKSADELRAAERQLDRDREHRNQEQRRLGRTRKELDRVARELDDEEGELAAKEEYLAIARRRDKSDLDYLTTEISRVDAEARKFENPSKTL
ncbi:hypothetical protein FY528_05145 [Hymenobacter lutimineralis]|uniref:Competence protein CoiA-like N-terminal domain-containing protein n=1 Tax=Hymenobacter lutimineralis TaxID=2606448 RepID=A0A5D6VD73_9BACT|nr:hypothetical protein [Hymenobacter lutimineralis]TYZ12678.1 hypothetical protein FY528_05145 [Hymenobacter lutimineralis]